MPRARMVSCQSCTWNSRGDGMTLFPKSLSIVAPAPYSAPSSMAVSREKILLCSSMVAFGFCDGWNTGAGHSLKK
eukprot:7687841-Lingulodinium_polyedra.AAC.1